MKQKPRLGVILKLPSRCFSTEKFKLAEEPPLLILQGRMLMYKHILFPTDGSAISTCAAKLAMIFAREIGAIVTGIYVCPEYHLFDYPGQNTEHALERYSHESSAHTIKLLAQVELMASEIGVKCDTVSAVSDYPYLEIIKAAEEKK